MNAGAPRYVIELKGNDHDKAADLMLHESLRICKEMGLGRITLLVGVKEDFPTDIPGKAIDSRIAPGTAKNLRAGAAIEVNGVNLHLVSIKTFDEYKEYEFLVGIYLSDKLPEKSLDVLDSPTRVKAIMYLPWTEKDGKSWLSTWNDATVLGQESWEPESLQLEESVVKALVDLTEDINLSTGLSNNTNKKIAKKMFADLRKKGFDPVPEDIRRWAMRNGWEPSHARVLAHQAEISLKCG